MTIFETFALLVFCHALSDYPVQATWIATTKSHKNPHPSGYPWYQSLMAHSVIHGGFVGIVTGSLFFAVLETFLHFCIDFLKNQGSFGSGARAVNIDQGLHILCKVIWAICSTLWVAK